MESEGAINWGLASCRDFGTPGYMIHRRSIALMKPSICICCGERMVEKGNVLSRNPNICASCSSLVDGMDESSIASLEPHIAAKSEGLFPKKARKPIEVAFKTDM